MASTLPALLPALLCVFVSALSLHPVSAQTFSLPEPTPSATPAPQGPADERAGVRINPRVIRDSDAAQTPAQTLPEPTGPSQRSTPAASPSASPVRSSATPALPTTRSPAPAPSRSDAVPAQGDAPQSTSRTEPETESGPVINPGINPGFDTEILPDRDAEPIGPDDWYDVTPDGETGSAAPASNNTDQASEPGYPADLQAVGAMALRNQVYIGLATMAVLALALAGLYWRRRRKEAALAKEDGPSLAFGVHKAIVDDKAEDTGDEPTDTQEPGEGSRVDDSAPATATPQPEPRPEPGTPGEPNPPVGTAKRAEPVAPASGRAEASTPTSRPQTPQADTPVTALAQTPEPLVDSAPPRIDVNLEIIGATRSVMMFTIDFSLEIANRSDAAVRELNISAQLATAQRGGSNAPPIAGGQPLAGIERMGPQQSRRIVGQLQMPLAEIKTIQQGSKPLFIPLLHFILEGKGQPVMNRSFVVGTPSSTSQTRVHPLTLDGPPGGLPRLRAQLIKQPIASGNQPAKAAERA